MRGKTLPRTWGALTLTRLNKVNRWTGSGPVGPLNTTEQPALLGLQMDGTENTPVYQGGPTTFLAGQDEPVMPGGLTEYLRSQS